MIRRTKLLASIRATASFPPAGYTELEYLQTTGEQYIATGLVCDQDSVLSMHYINAYGCLIGNISNSEGRVLLARVPSAVFVLYFGGATLYSYYLSTQDTSVAEVMTISKEGVEINGTSYAMTGDVGEFVSQELYIFASPPYSSSTTVVMYSATITIGGVVHEFVPMLDSAGVPCLYDKATGVSHYNAGTGEFLYGLRS